MLCQVPLHRSVLVSDVDRHRDPGGEWELHLVRDTLELLQELSDRLRVRRRQHRPVARLHLLVRGGQQQGHLRPGEQGRLPGREAQPLRLRLPRGGTGDRQRNDAASRGFVFRSGGDTAGGEVGGGSFGACCMRVVLLSLLLLEKLRCPPPGLFFTLAVQPW